MSRRVTGASIACVAGGLAWACAVAEAQPAGGDTPAPPPGEVPPGQQPPPGGPPPGEPPAPGDAPPPPEAQPEAPLEVQPPVWKPAPPEPEPAPEDLTDIGDQLIGGDLGVAIGGRTTAGGLRITGHYLYQLSDLDWFDGIASFTFGSGDAGCFRDRDDAVICDHGLSSGGSFEIAAGVRRMFAPQGRFRPFIRAAVGISIVRFGGDDLTGVALPLHAGAGLRAAVTPELAIIALADAMVGLAGFGGKVGGEPQLGLAITAGAEFRLR